MEQELKVLGKFLYSHFLCFFDSKADLLTSVTTSAQGNLLGYREKVAKSPLYLIKRRNVHRRFFLFFPLTSFDSAGGRAWSFSTGKTIFSCTPPPAVFFLF